VREYRSFSSTEGLLGYARQTKVYRTTINMLEETATAPLAAWESFYVIVGSSGAALTGLQFVVIALIAEVRPRSSMREIQTFGTPTIVHFCAVLLISAILSAPWPGLSSVQLILVACAVVGLIYGFIIIKRARSQVNYKPVWEDWLWYSILPLVAYILLLLAGILVRGYPQKALFIVAAVALLLLFIGIHNAWDSVTYIAVAHANKKSDR
jgi:hypothetical protein